MTHYYSRERNVQILISVLKANNIHNIIASPGTTNICFVASLQQDPFFNIYSAPDERSAGYMACGLAAETGVPVVLSCTGATASRNYMPAMTEAFYRKLPILAVTSSRRNSRIGHNFDQVTDRTVLPNDVAKLSVQLPIILDDDSEWNATVMANKAILELFHRGNGPVHINLETEYNRIYDVKVLPEARIIRRFCNLDDMPEINKGKIAIYVGSHNKWTDRLTSAVDEFCEKYDSLVLCDHTSNYKGKYRAFANLAGIQRDYQSVVKEVSLLIHIGNVAAPAYGINAKEVWRVNPDGEIKDTFKKLTKVFEMEEVAFFEFYSNEQMPTHLNNSFYHSFLNEDTQIRKNLTQETIDGLPFSNAWIALKTAHKLPENSVLHLGIQNSLRCWNLFEVPTSVLGYCNTGGFGIDGSISTVIGAALANKERIYFLVLGDLAFFYDLNSLGNRHVGKNIRILLVNNGKGTEFKLTGNPGAMFGDVADEFISAAGHYGKKSTSLVKHYAEDLGFRYRTASTKKEYLTVLDEFVSEDLDVESLVLEVFTNSWDEDQAINILSTIETSKIKTATRNAKDFARGVLGEKGTDSVRRILGME